MSGSEKGSSSSSKRSSSVRRSTSNQTAATITATATIPSSVAAAAGAQGGEDADKNGDEDQSLNNSFSVDIDHFSEECDIKIGNYRQAVLEEPVIVWSFNNPTNPSESFKFELRIRSDPNSTHGNSSGRQPPRALLNLDGTEPFSVTAKNLCGREVKCGLAVKVINEEGNLRDHKKDKCPLSRAPDATFSILGLGRCTRFLTQQGALMLLVKMEICNGLVYESGAKKIRLDDRKNCSFKTLSEDIKSMMNEPGFEDVSLSCSGEVVMCNKFLLCARSKVFRAMFFHPMKEAQESKVVIEDAEPETVRDLIEFVYSDKVQDICLERTVKLLPLAERYDIASLSGFCCEALATHLNVEHAAEVAMVAEQHQLKELKEKATAYMIQHSSRMIKTEGWQALLQACPDIANSIIANLSKYRDDNIDGSSSNCGRGLSSRGSIRIASPRFMFEDQVPVVSFQPFVPNNPEEEIIPQFQLDPNGPNHIVADEWNRFAFSTD